MKADLLHAGADQERALLVKWLRASVHKEAGGQIVAEMLERLAQIIENGAHHRPAGEQWGWEDSSDK
jgi:hypothetical protein